MRIAASSAPPLAEPKQTRADHQLQLTNAPDSDAGFSLRDTLPVPIRLLAAATLIDRAARPDRMVAHHHTGY
ncbi:hypothetical protein JQ633_23750 [Bradyrhizobium tropiciagri]|uniref:hypothetical protein n=1 Tax=Bradyrhizobium tropiciagri TaxID=312253 RepID=UPI001BAA73E7|nr:hypothetical protein [Bradyrhizobium tropiciagri]MBR0873391.1 hypothetical protein [Bradyrhizobium tropiciagri]